jgi:hypothetical protein
MNKVVEVVELGQTQQNSLNDSFRYEQQLVWDAILEEYKRLEKMYKSYFKETIRLHAFWIVFT